MNLRTAATTAKAVSAITWCVESTGKLIGKGSRAFISAVKHQKYYEISVVEESTGTITDEKTRQTADDVKSILESLEHFKGIKLMIRSENA